MESQRGSSHSRRSSSDSRRHSGSQHDDVEKVPNTARGGGQNDMYQVVMQLLQQQKAIQEQQNVT
ncbi:hypothetical protein E4U52_007087 [Claviceps spartinae]|nr:hypothetical protein E4U52_007087 [Claviceps spartinae]